ncbi:MAG: hypothetical protein ACRDV0_03025, partial [Acidimicrobiales bacterium]
FDRSASFRSPHPRSTAYAALGAVAVLRRYPNDDGARALVTDALTRLPGLTEHVDWPWPEPRLTYANALIPGARLACAWVLGERALVASALAQLDWLASLEIRRDRVSPTPVGGRGPDNLNPGFDQQPIEVASLGWAAHLAWRVSGEACWAQIVRAAIRWFHGDNDAGQMMWDPLTHGGFDGLRAKGVNRNQGAESTLAFVGTAELARSLREAGGYAWRAASSAASSDVSDAVAAPTW